MAHIGVALCLFGVGLTMSVFEGGSCMSFKRSPEEVALRGTRSGA
jgi:hypothetical protein